ncbi:MAG: hypothetical protein HKN75_02680 [Bacteroidia bacterium]|nr:hypothetical protein [Bacteroidia bacterium]
MKRITKLFLTVALLLATTAMYAQKSGLQYARENSKLGLNVFEIPKDNNVGFDGLHVKVGGDFALQFQGLSQTNSFANDTTVGDTLKLAELGNNFSLPTANLNLDVQLEDGVRMHLRTYLSSRHHAEAWVKGGYMQIDKLDFIEEGLLEGVMDVLTVKVGMDEINYGDAHFRRTDNAAAIYNPFVGNYIMDAFTTEPFAEFTVQTNGVIVVVGFTNGRLNQSPLPGDDGMVSYGKLGYDSQVNDDTRLRLTGSWYTSSDKGTRDYLYAGDRAGSRYYNVLETASGSGSDFEPRFNPRFAYHTAFQINPFVKYKGLEFFGVYEMTANGDNDIGGDYSQLGAELLYRFCENEDAFIGGRYNMVSGKSSDASDDIAIDRINIGAGWFMTDNVLLKAEYVMQSYSDPGFDGTKLQGAEFDGIMLEAVIGF